MLPSKYKWLEEIGTLPKIVYSGLQYLGIKEYPGVKSNNPVIMDMARALGVQKIYTNDETSWCALFIAYLCQISGKPQPYRGYEIVRALSFTTWGEAVGKGDERLGDIAVFRREGGGHVGIIIGESPTTYHILGGNQSNACTIAEIAKARCVAVRRYYAIGMPESAKKYTLSSSGKVSTNEA